MLAIASAEDFHAAVAASASSGKTLVACFSAPWCGGCKLVAPKVAELARQLETSADFAKVSAEDLESLCEELEVDSYPHFRVYQEGKRAGDYTSSKFEKVDVFIRGFVAPETLQVEKEEETPEGDAAETERTAEEAVEEEEATDEAVEAAEEAGEGEAVEEEGAASKKRQERDEMEANDEHVDKKAKTEEEEATKEEVAAAEEAVEDAEETQETAEEEEEEEVAEAIAEEADQEEEEVAEVMAEEEAPAEKVEEEAAPVDKLEASESAEVEADAAAA
ncbi:hypothetical protein PF007_g2933 [Phytophthora fragariae]|uniref:Thioredoxin domain-containing protein n=1 Tax=Phytophthora fragariae TaxID=53985 RepID=A0A6A3TDC2_9STRA|nr:hypothetical protein PF007_g2933 [Phytophthora fragariae]